MLELRVCSLNTQAYFGRGADRIERLSALVAAQSADVVLLQECRPGAVSIIARNSGMHGLHSHEAGEPLANRPPDGCAILVRSERIALERAWRIPPEQFHPDQVGIMVPEDVPDQFKVMPSRLAARYSARSLLALLSIGDSQFCAASFHATPGTGKVGGVQVSEWKPFFHGAVAGELARLGEPFVFGIDGNEPLRDSRESVEFHWAAGRPGHDKLAALLGLQPIHRARDLLRESLSEGPKPQGDILLHTHTIRGGGQRHFDHLWATKEFRLGGFRADLQGAMDAGTDHALLVADLDLTP